MSPMTRKGKWTSEEEALTAKIIHYFSLGVLQLPEGITLRAYLAQKLDCDPMRITKKFTGTNCLGKRVYHTCERTTATYEVAKQALEEVAELEERFRARLERNKEKRTGISDIEARTLTSRHVGPTLPMDSMLLQSRANMPPVSGSLHTFAPAPGVGGRTAPAPALVAAAAWPALPAGYSLPGYQFQPHHGVFRSPPTGLMPSGSSPMTGLHSFGMQGSAVAAAAAAAAAAGIGRSAPDPRHRQHPNHLTAAVLRSHQLQHAAAYSNSQQIPQQHQALSSTNNVHGTSSMSVPQQQSQGPSATCHGGVNGGLGQLTNVGAGGLGSSAYGMMLSRSSLNGANTRRAVAQQQQAHQQPNLAPPPPPPPPPASHHQQRNSNAPAPSPAGLHPQANLQTASGQMHNPYAWAPFRHARSELQQQGYVDYSNVGINTHGFSAPAPSSSTGFLHQSYPGGPALPAAAYPSQPWLQQRQLQQHMQQCGGLAMSLPGGLMATVGAVWNPQNSNSLPLGHTPSPRGGAGETTPISPAPRGALPPPRNQQGQVGSGSATHSASASPARSSSVSSSSKQARSPLHRPSCVSPTSSSETGSGSNDNNGSSSAKNSSSNSNNHDRAQARGPSAGALHDRCWRQRELGGAPSADAAAVVSAEQENVPSTMASPHELQQMYQKASRVKKNARRNSVGDGGGSTISSIPRGSNSRSSSSIGGTTGEGSLSGSSGCSASSGSRTGSGSDEQGSEGRAAEQRGASRGGRGQGGTQSGSTSCSESGCEEMDKAKSSSTGQNSSSCSRMDVDGAGGLLMGFITSVTNQHKRSQQQQQVQQERDEQDQEDSQKLRPIPPSPHAFPRVRHKHAARMEMEARCAANIANSTTTASSDSTPSAGKRQRTTLDGGLAKSGGTAVPPPPRQPPTTVRSPTVFGERSRQPVRKRPRDDGLSPSAPVPRSDIGGTVAAASEGGGSSLKQEGAAINGVKLSVDVGIGSDAGYPNSGNRSSDGDERVEATSSESSESFEAAGTSNFEREGYEDDVDGGGSSGKEESGSTEESHDPPVSDGEYGGGDERSSSFDGANDGDEDEVIMAHHRNSSASLSSSNDNSLNDGGQAAATQGDDEGIRPEGCRVWAC